MGLTHRVVYRYELSKRGAIFEAPPVMLEHVGKWVSKIYAGHVLEFVERKLATLRDEEGEIHKRQKAMKDVMVSVERDIKKLPDGKTLRYKVWHYDQESYVGARRMKGRWFFHDEKGNRITRWLAPHEKPKPDWVPVYEIGRGRKNLDFEEFYSGGRTAEESAEHIRKWIKAALEHKPLITYKSKLTGPHKEQAEKRLKTQIVESVLLKRECEKYTKTPKKYRANAQKSFPIDLTGWRYLSALLRKEYDNKKEIEEAQEGKDWSEVRVVLNFQKHKKTLGTWYAEQRKMRVDVRAGGKDSVEKFRDNLTDILRTLRHEFQHMAQDVLTALLALPSEAGTPARELAPTPVKPSRKRKPHALREQEFYTRLADEVDRFVRHVRSRGNVRENFEEWITDTEFFRKLRRHEPAKWRKAVGEFTKAIEARGIEIPGTQEYEFDPKSRRFTQEIRDFINDWRNYKGTLDLYTFYKLWVNPKTGKRFFRDLPYVQYNSAEAEFRKWVEKNFGPITA
jgi:hypothetical protein